MSSHEQKLIKVAQAEDTFNLLNHIAWTSVVQPRLHEHRDTLTKMLVDHLLGMPLPPDVTKEQIAGQVFGINYIEKIFKLILAQGEDSLKELQSLGINLT